MKILIDIDVIAVAIHYINDKDYSIAKIFIDRTKAGEFEVYSTQTLLELVKKWKEKNTMQKILDFYKRYSYTIPTFEIMNKSKESGIFFENIVKKLSNKGVKEEDAALTVIASLFGLILVTLNRKHLRNKQIEINNTLRDCGMNEIKILLPNEI